MLSGAASLGLGDVQTYRLRAALREITDPTELAIRLRDRATVTTWSGHRSVIERVRKELVIPGRRRLGLVEDNTTVDGYIPWGTIADLVRRYRLSKDTNRSITLRDTDMDIDFIEYLAAFNRTLAAVDAFTSLDPRERGVGEQVLVRRLESFRENVRTSAPGHRAPTITSPPPPAAGQIPGRTSPRSLRCYRPTSGPGRRPDDPVALHPRVGRRAPDQPRRHRAHRDLPRRRRPDRDRATSPRLRPASGRGSRDNTAHRFYRGATKTDLVTARPDAQTEEVVDVLVPTTTLRKSPNGSLVATWSASRAAHKRCDAPATRVWRSCPEPSPRSRCPAPSVRSS